MSAALKPCPSCQGPLAKSANACPRCGHKVVRTSCAAWGCLGLIVLAVVPAFFSALSGKQPALPPSPPISSNVTASGLTKPKPISEADRKKIAAPCQKMMQQSLDLDIFSKVVGVETEFPKVFTGSLWKQTTIDQKNDLIKAVGILSVLAVPLDKRGVEFYFVTVLDGGNGKKVGSWTSYGGYKEE